LSLFSQTPANLRSASHTRLRRWFVGGKWRFAALLAKVQMFRLIMNHPSAPPLSKWIATCAVAYLFSPIQLIPNFIPVLGQLDDVAVLLLAIALIRRSTPPRIFNECEQQASARLFVYWGLRSEHAA
jgi:uncharacterized membrane protein YkvA (DUF1232 family)